VQLHLNKGGVQLASIGVGGVAATPVRALQTEAMLTGKAWTQDSVAQAIATLRAEFQPISDMRASSDYRKQVLGNLLQRFWLESQGLADTSLANLSTQGALA
jgi:xanthine dehydrogenase small subunit